MSRLYIKILKHNKWIIFKLCFGTLGAKGKFCNIKISLMGILICVCVYVNTYTCVFNCLILAFQQGRNK